MKWLLGALAVVVITLLFSNLRAQKKPDGWGAMKYPQLVLGMLGIFVYVGTEVTIVSNFSELLKQPDFGGYTSSQVAPFISMYWGSLMVGRWTGSIKIFEPKGSVKTILLFVVPVVAFLVVLGVNSIAQNDMSPFYGYVICILIQAVAFWTTQDKPVKTLILFS